MPPWVSVNWLLRHDQQTESTTMTDDRMALLELAEKHADGDLFRELGQFALQRLMELEVEGRCGAAEALASATPATSH